MEIEPAEGDGGSVFRLPNDLPLTTLEELPLLLLLLVPLGEGMASIESSSEEEYVDSII